MNWYYINKSGENVGPVTDSSITLQIKQKTILPDTFLWKEGMADWAQAKTIPQFAGLFTGTQLPPPYQNGTGKNNLPETNHQKTNTLVIALFIFMGMGCVLLLGIVLILVTSLGKPEESPKAKYLRLEEQQASQNQSDIIAAIKAGDVSKVKTLIKAETSVDFFKYTSYSEFLSHYDYYWTPLMAAAACGETEIVKLLLEAGANIEEKGAKHTEGFLSDFYTYYGTPLMLAAENGRLETVKYLLNAGANIEAEGNDGKTALSYAGNGEVAKVLLDAGANIEAKDNEGTTALIHAAHHGYENVVQILLDAGANVNARDNDGKTALAHAKEWGGQ